MWLTFQLWPDVNNYKPSSLVLPQFSTMHKCVLPNAWTKLNSGPSILIAGTVDDKRCTWRKSTFIRNGKVSYVMCLHGENNKLKTYALHWVIGQEAGKNWKLKNVEGKFSNKSQIYVQKFWYICLFIENIFFLLSMLFGERCSWPAKLLSNNR